MDPARRGHDDLLTVVNAAAPTRICDTGGWTDTWFAGHGRVVNIAVAPYVTVQLLVYRRGSRPDHLVLHVEDYGQRYALVPGQAGQSRHHPLLEAAVERAAGTEDIDLEVWISSAAPPGCSTGTSAALSVALLGALDTLSAGRLSPHRLAEAAHRLEVKALGRQSGIQDQLCSAYGGINDIDMVEYPHATVSPVRLRDSDWWELERRLSLVYLGRGHDSSAIHEQVIARLVDDHGGARPLDDLRQAASLSRKALDAGDFDALGQAMVANTQAQERLHPSLVNPDARAVIDLARRHGAVGWKVNGAGGDGGSLTILSGRRATDVTGFRQALGGLGDRFRVIPLSLSREGLRVWTS